MRDLLTNLLDILGLLLIAAGIGAELYRLLGLAALAPAGAVVMAGSALAHWQAHRPPKAPPG